MVTDEDYFVYGQRLVELGAENVLLSLGEKGAILLRKTGCFEETRQRKSCQYSMCR